MGKNIGRPKLGNAKRRHSLKVSFNDEEWDIIDIKSSRAGITKSEYVRASSISAEVRGLLSEEERDLLHHLKKYGSNLNQIAHTGNMEGLISIATKAESLLDMITNIVLKLSKRMGR